MKKIKLLLVPSDLAGVGHFRTIWPGQQIEKDFSDEFEIEINHTPPTNDINYLTKFDIIHFHRNLGAYEEMEPLFSEIKKRGTKLIMDLDDYWNPPKTHPLYGIAVKDELEKKITTTLKSVNYVTTTTNIFAKHIEKLNKNVFVMPNAIDPEHRMWKDDHKKTNDKVRISWIGGSSHLNDLELLNGSMNILHGDTNLKGKYQIIMCGYDIRGHMTEIMPDGSQRVRKIEPHETVWNNFERIFTNNYACVSERYENWLKKHKNEPYPFEDLYEETFIRRWTLPLTQYGRHYSYCDVCLAPLAENIFNEVKSELKIIEAGMMGKVLIAQDFSVYKELLTHEENALLVPSAKNNRGWYKNMKKVIEDKELRNKLSTNLYNFVKDKYHIKNTTKERVKIYKSIL